MSMNLASFFMLDLELDSDTYLLQRKRALKSMIIGLSGNHRSINKVTF